MIDEMTDSLKAKLYDSIYTPFMSSLIVSWVVLNHRYIMIYFSDMEIDEKLKLLKKYSENEVIPLNHHDIVLPFVQYIEIYSNFFFFPILIALLYVFVYPKISHIFYKYTGEMENEKKLIKIKVRKEKALSEQDKEKIQLENYNLTKEIDRLKIEITTLENKYNEELFKKLKVESDKLVNANHENRELTEKIEGFKVIEEKLKECIKLYDTKVKDMISLEEEVAKKNKVIVELNANKSIDAPIENAIDGTYNAEQKEIIEKCDLSEDELKVLKEIYVKSMKKDSIDSYIDKLTATTNMKLQKVKVIVEALKNKACLAQDSVYLDVHNDFRTKMTTLFD